MVIISVSYVCSAEHYPERQRGRLMSFVKRDHSRYLVFIWFYLVVKLGRVGLVNSSLTRPVRQLESWFSVA